MKRQIDPKAIPTKDLHQYIIGAVAPRPIAFVSTLDEHGVKNLAPYSFFNAFSSNPPIVVFSSNRRVSNNTTKDTLHNVRVSKECVVNVVPYSIVRQMSLASVEFPSEVSEFEAVGLTPQDSVKIAAPGVLESPINMECVVKDIIHLGEGGGAGHLIICEVVHISISEDVLNDNRLDPHKLDLMGRLGRNYYVRASGDALIEIYQSVTEMPIGYPGLPDFIKQSNVLTGNDIATLASLTDLPTEAAISDFAKAYASHAIDLRSLSVYEAHDLASTMIKDGNAQDALMVLMNIK